MNIDEARKIILNKMDEYGLEDYCRNFYYVPLYYNKDMFARFLSIKQENHNSIVISIAESIPFIQQEIDNGSCFL